MSSGVCGWMYVLKHTRSRNGKRVSRKQSNVAPSAMRRRTNNKCTGIMGASLEKFTCTCGLTRLAQNATRSSIMSEPFGEHFVGIVVFLSGNLFRNGGGKKNGMD